MEQINMPQFVDVINQHIAEVKNILEVGSLNGQDALFLKNKFPKARVVAIEGLEHNYNHYMRNLPEIETYNMIISNIDGVIDYHQKTINGIHGIYDRGAEYGTTILKNLPTKKLQTFCSEINLNFIDVIKIDVEGATLDVLESCNDMLKKIQIMHIETESIQYFKNQKLDSDVSAFLIDNNFELLLKTACPILDGFQYDSIWLNRDYV